MELRTVEKRFHVAGKKRSLTVISVVMESEAPPNNLHKGTCMLLATASISAISTPALTFNHRFSYAQPNENLK